MGGGGEADLRQTEKQAEDEREGMTPHLDLDSSRTKLRRLYSVQGSGWPPREAGYTPRETEEG